MLIDLVEDMTNKWERQLEDIGEAQWTDDMLAVEGTDGEIIHTAHLLSMSVRGGRVLACWLSLIGG